MPVTPKCENMGRFPKSEVVCRSCMTYKTWENLLRDDDSLVVWDRELGVCHRLQHSVNLTPLSECMKCACETEHTIVTQFEENGS